jgi:hypothetical protein
MSSTRGSTAPSVRVRAEPPRSITTAHTRLRAPASRVPSCRASATPAPCCALHAVALHSYSSSSSFCCRTCAHPGCRVSTRACVPPPVPQLTSVQARRRPLVLPPRSSAARAAAARVPPRRELRSRRRLRQRPRTLTLPAPCTALAPLAPRAARACVASREPQLGATRAPARPRQLGSAHARLPSRALEPHHSCAMPAPPPRAGAWRRTPRIHADQSEQREGGRGRPPWKRRRRWKRKRKRRQGERQNRERRKEKGFPKD